MAAVPNPRVSTTPRSFPVALEVMANVFRRPLSFLWAHGFRFLGVLDALLLLGAADAVVAQLGLHLLQLELGLEQFLIFSCPFT